jgi:hypothetical protein
MDTRLEIDTWSDTGRVPDPEHPKGELWVGYIILKEVGSNKTFRYDFSGRMDATRRAFWVCVDATFPSRENFEERIRKTGTTIERRD